MFLMSAITIIGVLKTLGWVERSLFGEILASTYGHTVLDFTLIIWKSFLSLMRCIADHIWNTHCSSRAPGECLLCSWSSMLFKYGAGALVNLKYSSKLVMVQGQGHMVLDHKSRQKSQKERKGQERRHLIIKYNLYRYVFDSGFWFFCHCRYFISSWQGNCHLYVNFT